jgi:hypothetical protein
MDWQPAMKLEIWLLPETGMDGGQPPHNCSRFLVGQPTHLIASPVMTEIFH